MISASPFPAVTKSPTLLPSSDLASGATWEIDPFEGSASSSPTMRKVCSLVVPRDRYLASELDGVEARLRSLQFGACAPGAPITPIATR